ncbi:MAG: DUF4178 domain-containing protein [Gemmatimonadota bacterium]
MTAPRTTSCPNCGAAISFLWAQAVQTTCTYCKAVLVRRDIDVELVGTQAVFPETGSPIQLGVDGKWGDRGFTVVGRIAYGWERGRWNEWHCRMSDSTSAWLSDAQLEYAMTQQVDGSGLPDIDTLLVGQTVQIGKRRFEVALHTYARYLGTEGDLPFTTYDKRESLFIDLQNDDGGLATIDTTDTPPSVYVGEYLSFDALSFRGLREFEGW